MKRGTESLVGEVRRKGGGEDGCLMGEKEDEGREGEGRRGEDEGRMGGKMRRG